MPSWLQYIIKPVIYAPLLMPVCEQLVVCSPCPGDTGVPGDVHPHGAEALQWNVTHSCRSHHSSDGIGACQDFEMFWSVTSELISFSLPSFSALVVLVERQGWHPVCEKVRNVLWTRKRVRATVVTAGHCMHAELTSRYTLASCYRSALLPGLC